MMVHGNDGIGDELWQERRHMSELEARAGRLLCSKLLATQRGRHDGDSGESLEQLPSVASK
jgi:hypothetical protein